MEIKFRVWDGRRMWYPDEHHEWTIMADGTVQPFSSAEIMFYTGLKDRTGRDIYCGDILEFDAKEWGDSDDNKWAVVWNEEEGCWNTGGGTNSECSEWKTVIGNVWENSNINYRV